MKYEKDFTQYKPKNDYPPGNQHIPLKLTFEDDVQFPKVGYVSSLEGN